MRAKFEAAIQDFGKRLGVGGLKLDENGSIAMQLDETEILMGYVDAAESVQFYTILGGMPEEPSPQFLQVLLAANNLGVATNGAAIGYDADDDTVTLNLRVPVDVIDGTTLERTVENFVNLAEFWKANFADLERAERNIDTATSSGPPPSAGSWLRA